MSENYNYVQVDEADNSLQNEFNEFLLDCVSKWVEKVHAEIINELKSVNLEENTILKECKVEPFEALNVKLGKKLLFAEKEIHDACCKMYWSGKLKLSFTPQVTYYSKNFSTFKKYCMKVSLPNAIKVFVTSLMSLCETDDITIILSGSLYNGNGNRVTVYFDNLNEEFYFESDANYVTRFISLNLTYVKSK